MLGPLEAVHDGMQVPLGSRKQRALLAILLLRANEVVAADALIDELWGERPPPSAGHTLQVYVSRLRSAFGRRGRRRRDPRHATGGLPPARRLRRARPPPLRAPGRGGAPRARAGSPERAARAAPRGARRCGAAARSPISPSSRSPASTSSGSRSCGWPRSRIASTRISRSAGTTALVPEIERARRAASAARAAARPAHARALPRRPSGRRADRVPRRARDYLVGELGLEPRKELRALEQAMLRQDDSLELAPAGGSRPSVLTEVAAGRAANRASRRGVDPRTRRLADHPRPPHAPSRRGGAVSRSAAGAGALAIALAAGAFALRDRHDDPALRASLDVHANAVVFVDDARGTTVAQPDTGRHAHRRSSAGAGALWATDSAHDRVLKLDASSASHGRSHPGRAQTRRQSSRRATGCGSRTPGAARVSEISPASGTVVATVRVGDAPVAIAAGGRRDLGGRRQGRNRPPHRPAPRRRGCDDPPRPVADGHRRERRRCLGHERERRAAASVSTSVPTGRCGRRRSATGRARSRSPAVLSGSRTRRTTPSPGSIPRRAPCASSTWPPRALSSRRHDALWVARTRELDLVEIDLATRSLGRGSRREAPVARCAAYEGGLALATRAPPGEPCRRHAQGRRRRRPRLARPGRGWSASGLARPLAHERRPRDVCARARPWRGDDRARPGGRAPGRAGGRPHLHVPAAARRALLDGRSRPPGRLPRDVRAPIPRRDRPRRVRRPDPRRGSLLARPCDLSSGIAVDDAARTITFRLSEPDPDFLYKLALPFGSVVPAGSPPVGTGARPLPATGRVPDPALCTWPRGCAGAKLALPSLVGGGAAGGVPRQHHAAPRPGRGAPGRGDLRRHGGRDARQPAPRGARSGSAAGCPCNCIPSRSRNSSGCSSMRASRRSIAWRCAARVALAVDRRAIVELSGDRKLARPTCQILPPGFPGHQPYCPYTARPNAAGVWQAPDLVRARRLIAGSGTSGMRVGCRRRSGTIRRSARWAGTSSAC